MSYKDFHVHKGIWVDDGETIHVGNSSQNSTISSTSIVVGNTVNNTVVNSTGVSVGGQTLGFGYTGSRGSLGYSGSIGYTGSTGYIGSRGATGYTGSEGDQGPIGYTGSTGYAGSMGATGYQGSQGILGYQGSQGVVGYRGSAGLTGYQGSQGVLGYQGSTGYRGSAGLTGYQGSQGITGYQGSGAQTGYTGSQGIGYTGSASTVIGYTGSQGVGYTGSKGDTGNQGTTGYTGSKGDTGNQGEIGYSGSRGYSGSVGYTGSGFKWQGSWQGSTWYYINDVVSYNNSTYICIQDGYNISPANIDYWTIQVPQGETGYVGSQGYTGSASTIIGYTGSLGYTGSQGSGYTGSHGDFGYTGSRGYTGSTGAGYTGSQGSSGYTGSAGLGPYNYANLGSQSSGTFTPDPADGNYQWIIANGDFILGKPSNGVINLWITNGPAASTITPFDFRYSYGDTYTNGERANSSVTINVTSDYVTWTNHGLSNGDPIWFTAAGGVPSGITANTMYYVANIANVDAFQVRGGGGSIIDFFTAGSSVKCWAASVYVYTITVVRNIGTCNIKGMQ